MKILVANLGSTSLKYRLFEFANGGERLLARGGFERVADYPQVIEQCLGELKSGGWIQSEDDLAAIGFKTILALGVNGCVFLDERVVQAMEACNQIAPAHNPPYIAGIRLFARRLPKVPLVALFETAFYQWAPPAAMRYAVPEAWHELGVRRHGFHGASHKFIAERSAELLGRQDVAQRARQLYVDAGSSPVRPPDLRIISCHLGGSSSISGILNGVAIGNSLGMSPQSGLPQNNRVGDLDPFALPFLMRSAGLSLDDVERLLCKESGLKGLSGGFNDIRDIQTRAAQGDDRATLALDVFVHQARHWIGATQRRGRAGVYRRHRRKLRRTARCHRRQPRTTRHRARRGQEPSNQGAGSRHQRARFTGEGDGDSHQRRVGGGPRNQAPARNSIGAPIGRSASSLAPASTTLNL